MNQLYRCLGCGGTYMPVQPDGSLYAHHCAGVYDPASGQFVAGKNQRNENVSLNPAGAAVGIMAAGAGVARVSDGAEIAPAWQLKLAATAAKEQ